MSLSELISGAAFGVGLFTSGVYAPEVIKAQLNFTSYVMLTTMLSANMCSAVVMDIVDRLSILPRKPSPPVGLGFFRYDGNVLGGCLLGLGLAISGSCPGTSFVQAGAGDLRGILVILGGLVGAIAFVRIQHSQQGVEVDSKSGDSAGSTPLDIATALGAPSYALVLAWVAACLFVIHIILPSDADLDSKGGLGLLSPAHAGIIIGFAQLLTILSTKHAVGASGAFEDVARWIIARPSRSTKHKQERGMPSTGPVMFSVGVTCSAALLSSLFRVPGPSFASQWSTLDLRSAVDALLGGFLLVMGARIARGCTSGHGISGLSTFSIASLITTAIMFLTAIGCSAALGG